MARTGQHYSYKLKSCIRGRERVEELLRQRRRQARRMVRSRDSGSEGAEVGAENGDSGTGGDSATVSEENPTLGVPVGGGSGSRVDEGEEQVASRTEEDGDASSEDDSSEVENIPSGKDKGKGRADPVPEGSKDSGDQVCAGLS